MRFPIDECLPERLRDHVDDRLPPAVFVISEDDILTFADQIPSLPKLKPGALVLFRKTGLRIADLVQRSTTLRSAVERSNDP